MRFWAVRADLDDIEDLALDEPELFGRMGLKVEQRSHPHPGWCRRGEPVVADGARGSGRPRRGLDDAARGREGQGGGVRHELGRRYIAAMVKSSGHGPTGRAPRGLSLWNVCGEGASPG